MKLNLILIIFFILICFYSNKVYSQVPFHNFVDTLNLEYFTNKPIDSLLARVPSNYEVAVYSTTNHFVKSNNNPAKIGGLKLMISTSSDSTSFIILYPEQYSFIQFPQFYNGLSLTQRFFPLLRKEIAKKIVIVKFGEIFKESN